MKNTKKVATATTTELAVKLSDFNYSLKEFKDNEFFVFSYNWTNEDKNKTGTKQKIYGLQGDKKRLEFLWFKATLEEPTNGSLAYFGSKGFLQTCISEGILSEELV